MSFRYPVLVGGPAAIAASLLIHALPAWFCPWSEPAVQPETVCFLNLETLPENRAEESRPADQDRSSRLANRISLPSEEKILQTSEAPVLIQVPDEKRDTSVDIVLSRVRERLQPVWEQAVPPGTGQVELCLELTHQGEVHSVWVTNVYGSPQLADFVLELVREAGPYPLAGEYIAGRLTVGCTFAVKGN